MTNYVVDSNAWIGYFEKKPGLRELIENGTLQTPAIVVAEVTRVFLDRGIGGKDLQTALDFIQNQSNILDLDFGHAVKAGKLVQGMGFHMADAIIYSYASRETPVLTGDRHFRDKPYVHFLERRNKSKSARTKPPKPARF